MERRPYGVSTGIFLRTEARSNYLKREKILNFLARRYLSETLNPPERPDELSKHSPHFDPLIAEMVERDLTVGRQEAIRNGIQRALVGHKSDEVPSGYEDLARRINEQVGRYLPPEIDMIDFKDALVIDQANLQSSELKALFTRSINALSGDRSPKRGHYIWTVGSVRLASEKDLKKVRGTGVKTVPFIKGMVDIPGGATASSQK